MGSAMESRSHLGILGIVKVLVDGDDPIVGQVVPHEKHRANNGIIGPLAGGHVGQDFRLELGEGDLGDVVGGPRQLLKIGAPKVEGAR